MRERMYAAEFQPECFCRAFLLFVLCTTSSYIAGDIYVCRAVFAAQFYADGKEVLHGKSEHFIC